MAALEVIRDAGDIDIVSTLLDYIRRARKNSPTGALWLRGLSMVDYRLLPSIGRKQEFAGREQTFDSALERRLLHRFRRHSYTHYQRPLTEWEALFVARHHGLPVRLLDWTADPLAALFFACEYISGTPTDARIWFLIPRGTVPDSWVDIFDVNTSPFKIRGVRLVYPMAVSPRLDAQTGLFTIQADAWKPLDDIDVSGLEAKDVDIQTLMEFTIRSARRGALLKELNDLQVTRRTLFPDLDGLSRGLVTAEVMRGS